MKPFVLANEHVRLSAPTEADVDAITEICQDAEIQRWTTVPSPYLREHAEGFVREYSDGGWADESALTWAVRVPGDVLPGEPEPPVLGMVGLTLDRAPEGQRSGEIGYWAAPDARGRGLLTEAVRLVVDYGLDPEGLGLARVEWRAQVGNWPSRRVAWKTGFRLEAQVRGLLLQRGERVDGWIGTLLPGDRREPGEPWPADVAPVPGPRPVRV
ncbi:N-acetyltransferase [Xylanimonas oleitrophica]|uniref:N-acetyltransferase n=1 Tax=Xylanimonas oleitrophica TaxID=2607479 RepID=A0A2W5YDV4_9MICO|nr:GNAT family N-acetyltransferase [Xylanimonas oleitrophica]PZR52501.1 N-acetyltransferase [Xylanimonas oleitrophica]